MMSYFMCCFLLLTSFGGESLKKILVERGKSILLFGNVGNTDKGVSLYINGKKNNTLIVTWTIENTTITASWMPDLMATYSKISMDSNGNIWIANVDENYEGKYSILNSPSPEVELIILACAPNKYGPNCEYSCQCIENKTVLCHSQTGFCLCKPGWQGINCSYPCLFPYYGDDCSKTCNCLNNGNCNHITGQCDCQIGYKGDRCGDRCDEGTFGIKCQEKCQCKNGDTCETYNGSCIYTPGSSYQFTDNPVIIGLLSAILSIIVLYIILKNKNVIKKKWKRCCETQETIASGTSSTQEQEGNAHQSPTQQDADSTPVKSSGGTDPVLPREPDAQMNISEETDSLLPEKQVSNSASNKLSETELNFMPTARGRGIRLASISIRDNVTEV